jgi:hypothetical protein
MGDVSRRIAAAAYVDSPDGITIPIITVQVSRVGARSQRDVAGLDGMPTAGPPEAAWRPARPGWGTAQAAAPDLV